eukprot:COSAG02_NODE_12391_length_1554_cov_1.325773_2_plen_182_part_00
MLEVAMACVARYFFDDARAQVPKIVPCTLSQNCTDTRCATCQQDLLELETLLDTLNDQVDWAVVILLILAGTQLVRACSGGLFRRFSTQTEPLHESLLGSSIWRTAKRSEEMSYSWSRREPPAGESVQAPAAGQKRQKYTERQLRNGGARSDYEADTLATGVGVAAAGNLRPSFAGRFSED